MKYLFTSLRPYVGQEIYVIQNNKSRVQQLVRLTKDTVVCQDNQGHHIYYPMEDDDTDFKPKPRAKVNKGL